CQSLTSRAATCLQSSKNHRRGWLGSQVMRWVDGNVRVEHPREPWGQAGDSQVLVHCRLDALKGTDQHEQHTYRVAYNAAKFQFNLDVAFEIVERCADESVIDTMVDVMMNCDRIPRLVFPHPAFDDDDGVGNQEPIR